MVYSQRIEVRFPLDNETGAPAVEKTVEDKLVLEPVKRVSAFKIPKKFRDQLKKSGSHLEHYFKPFGGISESSIQNFGKDFPEWAVFKKNLSKDSLKEWTRKDHAKFESLLKFLAGKDVAQAFTIVWNF